MQNLILIGFMGSGKDSVGREIARRSSLRFLSTDRMIELAEKRSISAIFEESGESYFRRLESRMLRTLRGLQNIVLATGGGIVKDPLNQKRLARLGTVVHLKVTAGTVKKRLAGDETRPLLRQPGAVENLLAERRGMYDFAKITIATDDLSPAEIAEKILRETHPEIRIEDFYEKAKAIKTITVPVTTAGGEYPVRIGTGILETLPRLLRKVPRRCAVITNPLVGALWLDRFTSLLAAMDISVLPVLIPDGERFKSLKTVAKIYDALLEHQFDRSDLIIGLGGGVVTDIAGFVAATLKRGCRLIHIPTTLLAQVDASVGGKTGVNHPAGKNLIGSFYQPELVLADIELLKTLSGREYRNGLAEVIKAALIRDSELFDLLEKNSGAVLARDNELLGFIVYRCVEIKRNIVRADEREISGLRSLLNFGHTVGHMIEAGCHYRGIRHGEAVAIGMVLEAQIARQISGLPATDIDRIVRTIRRYRLPVTLPPELETGKLREHLLQDKKLADGRLKIPVLASIGKSSIKELTWQNFVSFMDQI